MHVKRPVGRPPNRVQFADGVAMKILPKKSRGKNERGSVDEVLQESQKSSQMLPPLRDRAVDVLGECLLAPEDRGEHVLGTMEQDQMDQLH